jgi:hypothetical protein
LVGFSENGRLRFSFEEVDPYFLTREGVAKVRAMRRYAHAQGDRSNIVRGATVSEKVLWEATVPVNFRGAFDIDLPAPTPELESIEVSWHLYLEFRDKPKEAFASFDLRDIVQ